MIYGSNYNIDGKIVKMFCIRLLIILIAIGYAENSVIRLEDEVAESLYDSNDSVFVLTSENFYQSVYAQPYASVVEFYNSFCGYCRSFAPTYKAFAQDMHQWNDIIHVSAMDCADDANNGLCRAMEIMRYPTLTYFPPHYRNESNNLGIEIVHGPRTVGVPHLFELLANSSTVAHSWPNLQPIDATSIDQLFASLPNHVQYIFIAFDPENDSTVARDIQKVALDLRKTKQAQIRHLGSPMVATDLALNSQLSAVYVGIKATKKIELLKQLTDLNRDSVRLVVEDYLKSKGIEVVIDMDQYASSTSVNPIQPPQSEVSKQSLEIIQFVKSHPAMVFQSDLESAIRYSIFHELVKYNDMNDEQISAMKGYISVLNKYSPLSDNGQRFLDALNTYVKSRVRLNGKELSNVVKELEAKYHPVFSSSQWIGCRPSVAGRRGLSCGLWQLFHYLTVSATNYEKSDEPLEVLRAIHGFVKHFFGCTHCSQHFQEMAEKNGIWKVMTKDEAVLWLWSAHNEVNRRLAGDQTEDPAFPKIQYPSQEICPQCYKQIVSTQSGGGTNSHNAPHWDNGEVLYYLRNMFSLLNLSRYGVDDESILPETLASVHSSKLQMVSSGSSGSGGGGGIFSEFDVRMGISLYAFCMLIIVVAVKLFLQRGYRKKTYSHDFWGKI